MEPIVFLAIEPKTKADQERLDRGLRRLTAQDPILRFDVDPSTGRTILRGMGDLHLEIIIERLQREFGVDAVLCPLQVAYKERLTRPAESEGRHVKQIGAYGQFAHVKIRLWPRQTGSGFLFENQIAGGAIPPKFIQPVEDGIRGGLSCGVLAGYPVEDDLRIELYDGSYHDTDSSEAAFNVVGHLAFQSAARKADAVIVEPVMRVEVLVPRECLSDIRSDLTQRRARLEAEEERGGAQLLSGHVPLSEMFSYAKDLRGRTQGRGSFSMHFERYEPAVTPPDGPLPVAS